MQEKLYLYQAKKRLESERYAEKLHMKYENYIKTVQEELEKQLQVIFFSIISYFRLFEYVLFISFTL